MGETMVLLGAGASAEAKVPTTFALTNAIVSEIAKDGFEFRGVPQVLNYVCGALLAHDSASGKDPFGGLDAERVLAAVDLLAQRHDNEMSAFVASWHPAVDAWDRPSLQPHWDRKLRDALLDDVGHDRARDLVAGIARDVTKGGDGQIYRTLSERMVTALRQLIAVTPKDVGYLLPLVEQAQAGGGLTVATLNYDLSVEGAAEAFGIPYYTGITEWERSRTWQWPVNALRLLKLHGSINWRWDEEDRAPGRLAQKRLTVVPVADLDREHDRLPPVLVFGARGKMETEGPFRSLLGEFEAQLVQVKQLIVVGYSFRDRHINQAIADWLIANKERTITIVTRGDLKNDAVVLDRDLNPQFERDDWEPRLRHVRSRASTYFEEQLAADMARY